MSNYKEADGLRWLDRGPSTDDHLAHGGHERELAPILVGMYTPGTTYINVGAHVGTWALRMVRNGATHVLAVEANPSTFKILEENVRLNDLASDRLTLSRAVLWDDNGVWVGFVDAKGVDESGSTRVVKNASEGRYLTSTLDCVLERYPDLPPVGLVQIDVEGAEARVLRGAAETVARDKPVLLIELHEGHPGTEIDLRLQVLDFLGENGYSWSSVAVGVEEYLICLPDTTPEFTDIA